jgi:hypothetical protein
MRNSVKMLVVPALVLAAACGRDENPMDEALRNDLSLASSMQPQQQFVRRSSWAMAGTATGSRDGTAERLLLPERAAARRAAADLPRAGELVQRTYSTGRARPARRR